MTTLAQAVHLASLPQPAARVYLQECCMLPTERERHLYLAGRLAEAAALDELAEIEENGTEREQELRGENKDLQAIVDRMENETRDMESAVEAAEEKVLTLESDLENAQDEIKALQTQIREASIDLV